MNWTRLAIAVPQVVGIIMNTVEKIKGPKTGPEKEKAVVEALPGAVAGIEGAFNVDFVNDPALVELLHNYMVARVALTNGIAAAQTLKPVVPEPPPSNPEE